MIRHIWSVLCSQSVRDADSGNVSLFNVLEQLRATLKPGAPEDTAVLMALPLEIVSLWERTDWELDDQGPDAVATAKLTLFDPAGNELGGGVLAIDVNERHRCRTTFRFHGIPLTVSGRYRFQVAVQDGETADARAVAEIPVEVEVSREDEAAATPD